MDNFRCALLPEARWYAARRVIEQPRTLEVRWLAPALLCFAAGAGLPAFLQAAFVPGRRTYLAVGVLLRWAGILLMIVMAVRRRSLTPWIFVAMVAGAEFGFDAPQAAAQARVFSDIFLRLIKTIVAPLILATLVVGIAGHGDLKGVGRIGIKALVYF